MSDLQQAFASKWADLQSKLVAGEVVLVEKQDGEWPEWAVGRLGRKLKADYGALSAYSEAIALLDALAI